MWITPCRESTDLNQYVRNKVYILLHIRVPGRSCFLTVEGYHVIFQDFARDIDDALYRMIQVVRIPLSVNFSFYPLLLNVGINIAKQLIATDNFIINLNYIYFE